MKPQLVGTAKTERERMLLPLAQGEQGCQKEKEEEEGPHGAGAGLWVVCCAWKKMGDG